MLDPTVNFGRVTVSQGYDDAATSIALVSGDGAVLPDPSTDGEFNLVWWDSTNFPNPTDDPNREIVRVTGKSTDTLTVTRAQEGTSTSTKNTSGATYQMILAFTKKSYDQLLDSPASSTDNAIVRFDGTGGDTVQDSGATISDAGLASFTNLEVGGSPVVVDSDIGVNVQAHDDILDDLSGLTQATDKIPYFDSATTASLLDFLDEDDMSSDSSTALASQQSIKAYADDSETRGVARGINSQTGTTYTLVLDDRGKLIELTNASAITLTVPPNSSVALPIGTKIAIAQGGAGTVSVAQGAGVTVKSQGSATDLNGQEAMATLVKVATDTWRLEGNLV